MEKQQSQNLRVGESEPVAYDYSLEGLSVADELKEWEGENKQKGK